MWPFSRRKQEDKKKSLLSPGRIFAGVVFGTAIASIIGKKMLVKHERQHEGEEWE